MRFTLVNGGCGRAARKLLADRMSDHFDAAAIADSVAEP
jgi:hypothetical protein